MSISITFLNVKSLANSLGFFVISMAMVTQHGGVNKGMAMSVKVNAAAIKCLAHQGLQAFLAAKAFDEKVQESADIGG